jgi:anti-anti-sigma regulatory factor
MHNFTRLTQRQVVLALMGMLVISCLVSLPMALVLGATDLAIMIGLLTPIYVTLLISYWRGWEAARYVLVVFITLASAFVLPENLFLMGSILVVFVPAVALVASNQFGMLGSFVVTLGVLIWRSGGADPYGNWVYIALSICSMVALMCSRLIADNLRRVAETNADQAERERQQALEARNIAQQQAAELAERNAEQQRLIDLVGTLETPAITIADGVILSPIVGNLDSRRAQAITARLLGIVHQQRIRLVVLDIAGVAMVDTAVAKALLNTTQSLRLLGCQVALCGMNATTAMVLSQLTTFPDVAIVRSPQDVLQRIAI